jgi:hypothetical protein
MLSSALCGGGLLPSFTKKIYSIHKTMNPKDPLARRRRSSENAQFKQGDKIRAIGGFGHHAYEPNCHYTVVSVDSSDHTLTAASRTGKEGGWIKWHDCLKADEIGWEWLKTVLPAEALDLLAAFDGVHSLSLREDLRNRLIVQIPGLHDKILGAMADEEAGTPNPSEDVSAPAVEPMGGLLEFEDLD